MKIKNLLKTLIYSLLSILIYYPVYAEEIKELTVTGGLMYSSWVESDSSITCGLTIETPSMISTDRYPVQVVLIIDASRGMEGAPIQNAKVSAKSVLDLLSDKDMFGLITYSQYAREVFPLKPLNQNNRRNAVSAVNRIKYEKGRNLSEGLKKGAEQFSRFKGQRSAGHYIILCTNGDAADGITNPDQLLSLAENLSKKYDIGITTIGYDRFYNEDFLIGCANKTGGRAYFIEEEKIGDMEKIFTTEIKRITETCVKDVTIEIITPSGSALENVYGGTLQDDNIVVGDIQTGIQLPVIFDITGRPSRRKDLVVNVDYVEPVRMSTRKSRLYLDIPVGTGGADYDKNFAPLLLEFSIKKGVSETIEQLRNSEKYVRKDYAELFRETVKKLEQDNIVLNSELFAESVEYFKQLQRDIENAAIEDELLIKRVKYNFLEFIYGKLVQ